MSAINGPMRNRLPEYWYDTCEGCYGEFPESSSHWNRECQELPDPPDPMDEMPESWLSPTPELEQEMTEWFEQADRLPDPDHN